ncbi:chemotaxis protein MotC [Allorhizobium sp. BGMRC 0089]|uniref:chemotaxis protein MotC n=1 Tax=Allorhizobium sonneratiae TaxID=2934936 RepID=UPI0020335025|nr:chemotaxis protein MotC [Allorhizobium sonneratiae]MCM2291376.1 chemotaxis protein MotC [Allorhizobium sonneratiae]
MTDLLAHRPIRPFLRTLALALMILPLGGLPAFAAQPAPPPAPAAAPPEPGAAKAPAPAPSGDQLAPYLMIRSLEYVQDSMVRGDHAAAGMQPFLLMKIDKRLRSAKPSEFADPRNTDAAFIYAMSGGNPATLEYLLSRDVDGHFDIRIGDALRKYFNGRGVLGVETIADLVPLYKDSRIGPYFSLVAGNVMAAKDAKRALSFYDLARLDSPGTIIEESALRRSLKLSIEAKDIPKAMSYANRYARRFLYSPYAVQFADLFVNLVVDHIDELKMDDVEATLAVMDKDHRRDLYLRIARKATIDGRQQLARLAAEKAAALGDASSDLKAILYGGAASLTTQDATQAAKTIDSLASTPLSPSDRALLEAARAVAREITTLPTAATPPEAVAPPMVQPTAPVTASPAPPQSIQATEQQNPIGPVAGQGQSQGPGQAPPQPAVPASSGPPPTAVMPPAQPAAQAPPPIAPGQLPLAAPPAQAVAQPPSASSTGLPAADAKTYEAMQSFVTSGQQKLQEIDKLLKMPGGQ